jgi:hypothetical protein
MSDPMARSSQPASLFERPSITQGTSKLAGEKAALSINSRRAKILSILQQRPSALFEVAAELGVYDHQISGRFTELSRDGLIQKTGKRRRKPGTDCDAEVWEIVTGNAPPAEELADRLGYPRTAVIEREGIFDRGDVLKEGDLPGVPYSRRADAGGVRLYYRVEVVECPGCGSQLAFIVEGEEKKFRCGRAGCGRTWVLRAIHEPGQPAVLALILKYM